MSLNLVMYPANTAALLSYLVLCLIECDILGRQKRRLIQSNKLPWAKSQMQNMERQQQHKLLSFHCPSVAPFSNSLCRRSTDLKCQGPEYLMLLCLLYKLFWSPCHECLTEGIKGDRVTHRTIALYMCASHSQALLLLHVFCYKA